MRFLTAITATITAAIFLMAAFLPMAQAQNGGGQQPIDISADEALEWDRENARYIARGNALAVQGTTTIRADLLTAYYDPGDSGATDLTELQAEGNVEIIDAETHIFGQQGTYDLRTEVARVTGDGLKMQTPRMVITADEYFEYDGRGGKVLANGNAVAIEGDKRLETEKIIAHLRENADGAMAVSHYEAPGRVKIITPGETATGNRGTYSPASQKAVLTGDVVITQEKNILHGEKAEVNMATGVSRMFAAEKDGELGGRVRGTFYPKQDGEE